MAAKKAPAKKSAAKRSGGNTGSARAAEQRVMKAKTVSGYSGNRSLKKSGSAARSRAAKQGKPVGPTQVSDLRKKTGNIVSSTAVKSARGNMYEVTEWKTPRRFRSDKTFTDTRPLSKDFRKKKK